MIYLSSSRSSSSSSSFFPSHLLFLFLSLFLVFLPSPGIHAQTITATTIPQTLTSPPPGPQTAVINYANIATPSTIVVSLIQVLQGNTERFVGETSTTVNTGTGTVTLNNLKINSPLLPSGNGVTYFWRVYAVDPQAYAFSPSIAYNNPRAIQRPGPTLTITAAATTTTTTTTRPTTTTTTTTRAGQTTTTVAGGTTTTRAASTTTTTRPITTLRTSTSPSNGGGGGGDQANPTNPPEGIVYKIISSTAVAGRWGMCSYTFQTGDTLPDIVVKLETSLGRLIQLNLDKFQVDGYVPAAGDVFQYDCFKAITDDGSDDGTDDGSSQTNPPQRQTKSSSGDNKSWIDNNVVIFIVVLVVGICLAAFLGIVLYKHIQAQLSTNNTTKKIATETKAAPPMSTPANKQWAQV